MEKNPLWYSEPGHWIPSAELQGGGVGHRYENNNNKSLDFDIVP